LVGCGNSERAQKTNGKRERESTVSDYEKRTRKGLGRSTKVSKRGDRRTPCDGILELLHISNKAEEPENIAVASRYRTWRGTQVGRRMRAHRN